jgi:Ser-tRNA(Ala) deacylase AlaX
MPDGGVHVKSTREIGEIAIQEITSAEGRSVVRYRVAGGAGPST